MNNNVTLTVNNKDYAGWKSVRIEVGLERIARSFELSVTEYWPGSTDGARRITPGDLVEIRIGDDLVCTGYVDATPIDYDAQSITIMIAGRSKTADLVDSSADVSGGQFKNLSAKAIAKKLADPYGLLVVSEVATAAALTDHQIQQGETAFESLDRIAKQRQILITDNETGDVVLAAPGSSGTAYDALVFGENILSASAGFDFTDVYSVYTVKGQKSGADDSFAKNTAESIGTAVDSGVKRHRVLVVRQSGQADNATCQNRAAYEQQIRRAKTSEIRYRVVGWRQSNGALWTRNTIVTINDPVMAMDNALLISEVIYTLDESGEITELVVIPPAAFATEPETKAKAKKRKKSDQGPDMSWMD